MATVANAAFPGPLDVPYSSPNRTGATSPLGAVTPAYRGELYRATDDGSIWLAMGSTSADWSPAAITS